MPSRLVGRLGTRLEDVKALVSLDMAFDSAVVVGGHVVWSLLTEDAQADLTANFPRQAAGVQVTDTASAQFEAWLDTAYLLRHAFDNIADTPFS